MTLRTLLFLSLAANALAGMSLASACSFGPSAYDGPFPSPPEAGSGGEGGGDDGSSGDSTTTEGGGGDGASVADGGDGSTAVVDNCPPGVSCSAPQNCCLVERMNTVWGLCADPASCQSQSGSFVACGSPGDCAGQPGTTCCLIGAGANGIPSSACMSSCPDGGPPACNGDNSTCPDGGAGWSCSAVPGVPVAALGACVPAPVVDGGAGDAAGQDSGATDAPAGG
jgi:hypothetical protein